MERGVVMSKQPVERQAITGIIRQPVVSNNLLIQDSEQSNSNFDQLLNEVQQLELSSSDQRYMIEDAFIRRFPSLWALKYKTIKGKPTTYVSTKNPFKHRPWQQAILDDVHPNKVIEKSRQLGLSEVGMTEVLHFLATHDNTKAMYIFRGTSDTNHAVSK